MGALGPFGSYAQTYLAAGLIVFPAGGEDGKKPLIRNWQKIGRIAAAKLIAQPRFRDANIGIPDGSCGGITRIDVDDPDLMDTALKRFGDTPIKVKTPSPGFHLWYRANGERRIIRLDGVRIDVLGHGGYGVAPPSINPLKGLYIFIEGHPGLIAQLPPILAGAVPADAYSRSERARTVPVAKHFHAMRDGDGRNDTLFGQALRIARESETVDDLGAKLLILNGGFAEPLPRHEVERIAASATRYKLEDRLWLPGCEARAQVTASELKELGGNAAAVLLLMRLRAAQGCRNGDAFPLANALADSLGWGLPRFRKALSFLVDQGFLVRTHIGGKGPHDPPRYRLLKR